MSVLPALPLLPEQLGPEYWKALKARFEEGRQADAKAALGQRAQPGRDDRRHECGKAARGIVKGRDGPAAPFR